MLSKPNQQKIIDVSWLVQFNSWFHLSIGYAMKNYPSQVKILSKYQIYQKLLWFYFYVSWFIQQNSWFELTHRLAMKNDPWHVDIYTYGVLNHHWNLTKPNQTNWKLTFGQKIWTWTTFTLDNLMIFCLISELPEVNSDFSTFFQLLGPVWKKNFYGSKRWVKTPLNPKFQNHSDMNAYLRSHFCSNFNWTQYFFLSFLGPNLACMWSVCTSAFRICAYLSDLCKNGGLRDKK